MLVVIVVTLLISVDVQVSTFCEIVDPNGHSTDEDSYKALTALGILSTLQSLIKATFNEKKVSAL